MILLTSSTTKVVWKSTQYHL